MKVLENLERMANTFEKMETDTGETKAISVSSNLAWVSRE